MSSSTTGSYLSSFRRLSLLSPQQTYSPMNQSPSGISPPPHLMSKRPRQQQHRTRSPFNDRPADPIPPSYLDASIPTNLPPRRSMKMLKDGSDFVWPDSAHALFVKGLQAWKIQTIGSKRTRAPRGEGKTDFLVRFLQNHGVTRTKKQVASHLQVLRTEWRNLDNPVLLSLVEETHSRSMSEPLLPPPDIGPVPTTTPSVFEGSPDPNDDGATPVSTSLHSRSPSHQIVHSQVLSITTQSSNRVHSSPDLSASWQRTNEHHDNPAVWTSPTQFMGRQHGLSSQNTYHDYDTTYDSPISPHDYERNGDSLTLPTQGYAHHPYYHLESSSITSDTRQGSFKLSQDNSPGFNASSSILNPYHQNYSSNHVAPYVYHQTRPQNEYALLSYPTHQYVADTVAHTRRPSYVNVNSSIGYHPSPSASNSHFNPSQADQWARHSPSASGKQK